MNVFYSLTKFARAVEKDVDTKFKKMGKTQRLLECGYVYSYSSYNKTSLLKWLLLLIFFLICSQKDRTSFKVY